MIPPLREAREALIVQQFGTCCDSFLNEWGCGQCHTCGSLEHRHPEKAVFVRSLDTIIAAVREEQQAEIARLRHEIARYNDGRWFQNAYWAKIAAHVSWPITDGTDYEDEAEQTAQLIADLQAQLATLTQENERLRKEPT